MKAKSAQKVAMILLVIGGLNWGLVGLLNLDIVATIFGAMSLISRVIYVLAGAAAVYVGAGMGGGKKK